VDEVKAKKKISLAVRCVWNGCGIFPSLYDGNTVFACANFDKRPEGKHMKQSNQFQRFIDSVEKGTPPVLGEIKVKKKT